MRVYFIALAILCTHILSAQNNLTRFANDAYVITRMAEKFHLQPKPLNNEFSTSSFDRLLSTLDGERIFFTQEDIKLLSTYRLKLDAEVLEKKSLFLQLLSDLYEKRLRQVDTMLDNIGKASFEFVSVEKLTVAEDTGYAVNIQTQKTKIRKLLKWNVLEMLLEEPRSRSSTYASLQKNFVDSLEPIYRKKVLSALKRFIKKEIETPGGIPESVGESYCEMIATYYDPHTNYFSLTQKENFDSELGQKSMLFGFGLDEDAAGHVIISHLKPGSPAYQSGQLNEGDKIIAIKWEGRSEIDVSDASIREVSSIIAASNHDKAKFTVQKADASKREVELSKTQMEEDQDAEKVKSFILKGSKTIGYISLPAFYEDWENEENNLNGCANDVAREIIKLKKENVEGLILDLRYNGGGSVREAVELAGIFIDVGAVAMEKDRNAKVYTLKDMNRGTIYDGPLFLMVNGYSASASELVAGTLQDYNRAIIVGSTTFGKATSQAVLPMDTTISLDKSIKGKKASSYLKLTLDKLYRVTGSTAQFSGVQPDVAIPDIIEADPRREANELFAIPATGIEASKLFRPLPSLNKGQLQQYANSFIDTSSFFKLLGKYVKEKQTSKIKKDISLNWKDAYLKKQTGFNEDDVPSFTANKSRIFTVINNQFLEQRLKSNKELQSLTDAWRAFLESDPYLQITYLLAIQFLNKP